MKITKIILPVLILALLLCGCGTVEPTPTVITYGEMSITLPGGFVKLSDNEYEGMIDFTYGSEDKLITGVKEPLEMVLGQYPDMTLESYAQLVVNSNALESSVEEKNGLLTITFENSAEGETFRYMAAVYQSWDGFWLIQMGCDAANFEANEQSFLDCLGSVQMAAPEEEELTNK